MTNKTDEKISALFDGELGRFETRRWTAEILKDDPQAARVGRYQIIGDVLREDLPATLNQDFSGAVMQQLDDVEIESHKRREWLKPAGGVAVAASVALVSLLTLRTLTAPDTDPIAIASLAAEAQQLARDLPAKPQTLARVPVTAVNNPITTVADTDNTRPEPKVRQLSVNQPFLTNYIATHSQYADPSSMMSHIRLVGYELNPQQ